MNSHKKDFSVITIIGALVGILIQPVIVNIVAAPSILLRVGIFLVMLAGAPLALFLASLLGKVTPVLYQFAKFAAVGVLNTSIDIGVLNIEIFISGVPQGIAYSVFKAISFLFATTNSFFWNKYWTFNATHNMTAAETGKFYVVAVVGWVLNVAVASFVVNGLGHPANISPNQWANVGALFGVGGAFLWDFLGYKYFVFKESTGQIANGKS